MSDYSPQPWIQRLKNTEGAEGGGRGGGRGEGREGRGEGSQGEKRGRRKDYKIRYVILIILLGIPTIQRIKRIIIAKKIESKYRS